MLRVKDNQDFVKDPVSGAVVNINSSAYENAMRAHKIAKEREERMQSMEGDINNLKEMLNDVRGLLAEFKQGSKE